MKERHYRRLIEIDDEVKLLESWKRDIVQGKKRNNGLGIRTGMDVTIQVKSKHYIETIEYENRMKYVIAANIILNAIDEEIQELKEEKKKIQTVSGAKWWEIWKV